MNEHNAPALGVLVTVALVAAVSLLFSSLYVVDVTEQVVITEFGKPVREASEPGLKLKKPFVQKVNRLEKRILAWDGDPGRMPTKDKKNINIDVWARWRITKARVFFEALRTVERGHKILDDLVDSAVRDIVGGNNLIEVVRLTNRELKYEVEDEDFDQRKQEYRVDTGRTEMEQEIMRKASERLEETYGMTLVDVKIKRINYVENVRKSVYDRMKAERQRIASRYASEASEQSEIILGETNRELASIEGEGSQKSQEIKGKADAEAIQIFGDAFGKGAEFYAFLRALESYKTSFGESTELVLSTDNPFLQWLRQGAEVEKPQ